MPPRVYIETTIPSYLTCRPSADPIRLGHELETREWWDTRRQGFELVVSELVLEECSAGDPEMAAARLGAIGGCAVVALTPAAAALAADILAASLVPAKANADALHIAQATVHQADFLLTWNCTHIANPFTRPQVEALCRRAGYRPPVICTPSDLLGAARD